MMASPCYQDPGFYFSTFNPDYQASTSWSKMAARATIITSHLRYRQSEKGNNKKDKKTISLSLEETSWKLPIFD